MHDNRLVSTKKMLLSGLPTLALTGVIPVSYTHLFPPASDTPLVLKWLASKIQPELFKDMDMDQEIKDYYEKYYNVTLTDEDLQKIYNPVSAAAGV